MHRPQQRHTLKLRSIVLQCPLFPSFPCSLKKPQKHPEEFFVTKRNFCTWHAKTCFCWAHSNFRHQAIHMCPQGLLKRESWWSKRRNTSFDKILGTRKSANEGYTGCCQAHRDACAGCCSPNPYCKPSFSSKIVENIFMSECFCNVGRLARRKLATTKTL